jgi:hypothetical protein
MSQEITNKEDCPICLTTINGDNNKVITECGHTFHCICLMQNVSVNGFACPCCRCDIKDNKIDKETSSEPQDMWSEPQDMWSEAQDMLIYENQTPVEERWDRRVQDMHRQDNRRQIADISSQARDYISQVTYIDEVWSLDRAQNVTPPIRISSPIRTPQATLQEIYPTIEEVWESRRREAQRQNEPTRRARGRTGIIPEIITYSSNPQLISTGTNVSYLYYPLHRN